MTGSTGEKRADPEFSGGVDESELHAKASERLDADRPGDHGTLAEERVEAIAVGAKPTPIAAEPKSKPADVKTIQRWLGPNWSGASLAKFQKAGIDTPLALENFKKLLKEKGVEPKPHGFYSGMVDAFKKLQADVRQGKNLDMKKDWQILQEDMAQLSDKHDIANRQHKAIQDAKALRPVVPKGFEGVHHPRAPLSVYAKDKVKQTALEKETHISKVTENIGAHLDSRKDRPVYSSKLFRMMGPQGGQPAFIPFNLEQARRPRIQAQSEKTQRIAGKHDIRSFTLSHRTHEGSLAPNWRQITAQKKAGQAASGHRPDEDLKPILGDLENKKPHHWHIGLDGLDESLRRHMTVGLALGAIGRQGKKAPKSPLWWNQNGKNAMMPANVNYLKN